MSLPDQIIAANDLRYEVDNYKRKGTYSWNCSCKVCGDSSKDKRKARFWIGKKSQSLLVHCFNCGYSNHFVGYLKNYHTQLYDNYRKATIESQAAPITYEINSLFKKVDDDTLLGIFYGHQFTDKKQWLDHLVSKKIKLEKYNLVKLMELFDGKEKNI